MAAQASLSYLVENPEDRFSHDEAHIYMSRAMRKCVLCHMRTTKTQISLVLSCRGSHSRSSKEGTVTPPEWHVCTASKVKYHQNVSIEKIVMHTDIYDIY